MGKHEIWELQSMQAAPLSVKVALTKQRIREWVEYWGEDHVYVSFSGGKDSTVLLHIAREMYPGLKAVFSDTTLEFPEIREFVKKFDNVDWVKPKMTFKEVVSKYGYPIISKEVAECVYGARRYLKSILTSLEEDETVLASKQAEPPYRYRLEKLCGFTKFELSNEGGPTGSTANSEESANSVPDRMGKTHRNKPLWWNQERGGGLAATEQILEIADGKHAKESDGSWRRFGLLSGTFTPDCRIDKRLYQGGRQSQGAEASGDKHKTGQNDSGEHP